MLFITSQLLLTLLWIHQSIAADTCSVIGLPDDTQRRGNVYFLRFNVPSVELSLQCRCTVSTPSWVQYRLYNDTFTNALPRSVECVKNGTECSPKRYIILPSQVEPGFYLYQNYTFQINEPTVLLCSSTNEKLTVVVNVQVNNYQDHSTTTGNLSTTEQFQPCLQTSTTSTIHNTAVDGGGTSTTATSSSLIPSTTTNVVPSVTKAVEPLTATATVTTYHLTSTTTSTSTTSASTTTTTSTSVTVHSIEAAVSSTDASMSSQYSTSAEVTPIIVIGKNTEVTDCSSQAFGTPTFIFLSLMCLLVIVNVVLVLYIVYIKKTHIKVAKEFEYLANNISRRGSTIDSRERSESVDNEQSPTHSNSEV